MAQTDRDAESPEAAQLEVWCGYRQASSIPDEVGHGGVSKKKRQLNSWKSDKEGKYPEILIEIVEKNT